MDDMTSVLMIIYTIYHPRVVYTHTHMSYMCGHLPVLCITQYSCIIILLVDDINYIESALLLLTFWCKSIAAYCLCIPFVYLCDICIII